MNGEDQNQSELQEKVRDEIPKRSSFWLEGKPESNPAETSDHLFDRTSFIMIFAIIVFSLLIFWPLISKFTFKEVFFTPLLPFLINVGKTLNFSPNDVLKAVYILSFIAAAAGIYLLVRDMTKRQVTPIFASLIFLIAPIPIFVLPFFLEGLAAEQLKSAISFFTIFYGDATHLLSLALLPYVVIFFQRYLEKGKTLNFMTTVTLCALTLLVGRTQSINLLIVLSIVALNGLLLGQARNKLRRLFFVVAFSIGMVSFWYTPSFWLETVLIFNKYVLTNLKYFFPLPAILAVLGLFFSYVFFGKRQERRLIFISFLGLTVFLATTAQWFFDLKSFVPYPYRLIPVLNIFGSIVLAQTIASVIDKLGLTAIAGKKEVSQGRKIFQMLAFGIVSFAVLTVFAFLISPMVINFISGPHAIWTRIRIELASEKEQAQTLAGGNFNFVKNEGAGWESSAGLGLTVLFLIWLFGLGARGLTIKEEDLERETVGGQ